MIGSGTFTLNTIEVTSAWNNGETATFEGYDDGVLVDTVSFGISSTSPTLATFNWSGLTSFTLVGTGGSNAGYGGSGEQLALDDVTVNAIPVAVAPEPSSLVLLGTGALGLADAVRRRITA